MEHVKRPEIDELEQALDEMAYAKKKLWVDTGCVVKKKILLDAVVRVNGLLDAWVGNRDINTIN